MSIIGEYNAATTAGMLEKIILNLINDKKWSGVRSAARGIARDELYEWYLNECADSYGIAKPNPEIVKEFGEIKKQS